MIIRCWGTRGSLPVSGREYLKYGGDTTCIEVRSADNEVVIVDAGSGIRALGNQLMKEHRHRYTLLLTHTHWDHLIGFPYFKPIYFRKVRVKIFGCPFAQKSVKRMIRHTMAWPNFPVDFKDVKASIAFQGICTASFPISSLMVTPILLNHPNQGVGYQFTEGKKRFVFLTDNELAFHHRGGLRYDDYVKFCYGADLLFHDAEFTPEEYPRRRSWGHSVYTDVIRLAMDAHVHQLGLIHHNQDRVDSAVDRIVARCLQIIARKKSHLKCFAVRQGMKIRL
jgi:phosphoribosyl 1,2-cyclic phosphodiesterase